MEGWCHKVYIGCRGIKKIDDLQSLYDVTPSNGKLYTYTYVNGDLYNTSTSFFPQIDTWLEKNAIAAARNIGYGKSFVDPGGDGKFGKANSHTKWESSATLMGWFSNIWGDAAWYTLAEMSAASEGYSIIKGIYIGSSTVGYAGLTISLGLDMYRYKQNPTWGNAGRVVIDAASIGISYAWPGPGTVLGVSAAALSATGGFDSFYNFLDNNQAMYNNTGFVMMPGFNSFHPLLLIKIK